LSSGQMPPPPRESESPSVTIPESIKQEIVRRCNGFRVTIVYGQTGCGKVGHGGWRKIGYLFPPL
jgi:hypothetical protein